MIRTPLVALLAAYLVCSLFAVVSSQAFVASYVVKEHADSPTGKIAFTYHANLTSQVAQYMSSPDDQLVAVRVTGDVVRSYAWRECLVGTGPTPGPSARHRQSFSSVYYSVDIPLDDGPKGPMDQLYATVVCTTDTTDSGVMALFFDFIFRGHSNNLRLTAPLQPVATFVVNSTNDIISMPSSIADELSEVVSPPIHARSDGTSVARLESTNVADQLLIRTFARASSSLAYADYSDIKIEPRGHLACGPGGAACTVSNNCGNAYQAPLQCYREDNTAGPADDWRCAFETPTPTLPVNSGCNLSVTVPNDLDVAMDYFKALVWFVRAFFTSKLGVTPSGGAVTAILELEFPSQITVLMPPCSEGGEGSCIKDSNHVVYVPEIRSGLTSYYNDHFILNITDPVPMPWTLKWTVRYPELALERSGTKQIGKASQAPGNEFRASVTTTPAAVGSTTKAVEYFIPISTVHLEEFISSAVATFPGMDDEASCRFAVTAVERVFWPFSEQEVATGTGIGSAGIDMPFKVIADASMGSTIYLHCEVPVSWQDEGEVFVTLSSGILGVQTHQKLIQTPVGTSEGYVDLIISADAYIENSHWTDALTVHEAIAGTTNLGLVAFKATQTPVQSGGSGPDYTFTLGMRFADSASLSMFIKGSIEQRLLNESNIEIYRTWEYSGPYAFYASLGGDGNNSYVDGCRGPGVVCVSYNKSSDSHNILDTRSCFLADDTPDDSACTPQFTAPSVVRNGDVDSGSPLTKLKSVALTISFERARVDNWFMDRSYRAIVTFPHGFTRTAADYPSTCAVSSGGTCNTTIVGDAFEVSFAHDDESIETEVAIELSVTSDFILESAYSVELTAIVDAEGTNYLEGAPFEGLITVPVNVISGDVSSKALRTDDVTVIIGNYASIANLEDSTVDSFILSADGVPVACHNAFTVGIASPAPGSADGSIVRGRTFFLDIDTNTRNYVNDTTMYTISTGWGPLPEGYVDFDRFPFIALMCDPVPVDATVTLDAITSKHMRLRLSHNQPVEAMVSTEGLECVRLAGTVVGGVEGAITDDVLASVHAAYDSAFVMVASQKVGDTYSLLTESSSVARVCVDLSNSESENLVAGKLALWLLASHAGDYIMGKVIDQVLPRSGSSPAPYKIEPFSASASEWSKWDYKCLDPASGVSSRAACVTAACSNGFVEPPVCWFGSLGVGAEECDPAKELPVPETFCSFPVAIAPAESDNPDEYTITWEDVNDFALADGVDARVSLLYPPAPVSGSSGSGSAQTGVTVLVGVVTSTDKNLTFSRSDIDADFGTVRAEVYISERVLGVSADFLLQPACVLAPCETNGVCNMDTGVCECKGDWSGPTCAVSPCEGFSCNPLGGSCVVADAGTASCKCELDSDGFPRFSGPACDHTETRCAADESLAPCSNGGVREEDIDANGSIVCGECACEGAWEPSSNCTACGHACYNGGAVNPSCDICACDAGYRSSHCECRHMTMSFVVLASSLPFSVDGNETHTVDGDDLQEQLAEFVESLSSNLALLAQVPFVASLTDATSSVSPAGTRFYTVRLMVGPDCTAVNGDVGDDRMLPTYRSISALKTVLAAGGHRSGDFPALAAMHDKSGFAAEDPNCRLDNDDDDDGDDDECPSGWAGKGVFVDESKDDTSSGDGLSTGAIVGIAIGGSVLLIIILAIVAAAVKGWACFAGKEATGSGVEMTSV